MAVTNPPVSVGSIGRVLPTSMGWYWTPVSVVLR